MLKRRTAVWLMGASVLMLAACLNAQENGAKPQQVAIRAARLIDGKSDAVMSNGVVLVEGEKITAVASGIAFLQTQR